MSSITINIMSYRYGHLAAHCIESVLSQTRRPDVIRFYDDGAGDCGHLPEIYPEVEFILRPKNLGVIANFNDAIDHTTTDRVMFLGADNWLYPKTLELVEAEDADIVSYAGWLVKDGEYAPWSVAVPHGSSLYNVTKAKAVGGYGHSGNEHAEEDSVLFSKMIKGDATVKVLDSQLLFYRWRHRRNFNQ